MFFDEKKTGNLPIIRPSLQLYGKVVEKPTSKEWYGCHSKNLFKAQKCFKFSNLALTPSLIKYESLIGFCLYQIQVNPRGQQAAPGANPIKLFTP